MYYFYSLFYMCNFNINNNKMLLNPLTNKKYRTQSARPEHPHLIQFTHTFLQMASNNKNDNNNNDTHSNRKEVPENIIVRMKIRPMPIKRSQKTTSSGLKLNINNLTQLNENKKMINTIQTPNNINGILPCLTDTKRKNKSIPHNKAFTLANNPLEQEMSDCCGSPILWLKKSNETKTRLLKHNFNKNNNNIRPKVINRESINSQPITHSNAIRIQMDQISSATTPSTISMKYNTVAVFPMFSIKEKNEIGEELTTSISNEFNKKNNNLGNNDSYSNGISNNNNSISSKTNNNNKNSMLFKTMTHKVDFDSFLHKTIEGNNIKWIPGEIIYEGSTTVIYKAINQQTGSIFIVKRFISLNDTTNNNNTTKDNYSNELLIYNQLSHENIIKFYGNDIIDNTPFLYLEYISGGNLKSLIELYGPLNEVIIRVYLIQILKGLLYLHQRKIAHRDIKCSNILLDDTGIIKLCDFGVSAQNIEEGLSDDEFMVNLKGTLPWCAPEVICNKNYGLKADIWSLGCAVIEMGGLQPWGKKIDNSYQCINIIGKSDLIPEIPQIFSKKLKDFIMLCLIRNPKDRADCKQLMHHDFIIN